MQTELIDAFAQPAENALSHVLDDPNVIGIRDATFTWVAENAESATPGSGRRNFRLSIDEEVVFKRGHINLIVGPTGSGKTSLLMALLGPRLGILLR